MDMRQRSIIHLDNQILGILNITFGTSRENNDANYRNKWKNINANV